jgi:hypothetical protein
VPLGDEVRLIDNSKSSVEVSRRLTVTQEWLQSYVVEYERSGTTHGELAIGPSAVGARLSAESKLRDHYSISGQIRKTHTEEVSVAVPAHVKLRIQLHWKQICQTGLVRLRDDQDRETSLPFSVAVGVTFDQTQIDEA